MVLTEQEGTSGAQPIGEETLAASPTRLWSASRTLGSLSPFRRSTPDLVQMVVSDMEGRTCKVDIGVFWRAHEPVVLDVGPVLHADDAVAGKMDALYNRWAPRDFLDVDAILISGRCDRRRLESIAHEHNPGFNREMFAQSLAYLTRIPDREFTSYGIDDHQIATIRSRFAEWHRELTAT
jgi:hypothetical protein